MPVAYQPVLVVLSVVIAIIASYTALDMAGRVSAAASGARVAWLTGGSVGMGIGIWSMHFVAMLAFSLPVPIGYDAWQVVLSALVAVAASWLALALASRDTLGTAPLLLGGLSMGPAIAGMHYIGMAAMRMAADTSYQPTLVVFSVLIAITASMSALWLAHRFRRDETRRGLAGKVLSAVIMGFAIAGMHYTAMAAARFTPAVEPSGAGQRLILAGPGLSAAVTLSTLIILSAALAGASIDRRVKSRILEAARQSEEELRRQRAFLRQVIDADPNLLFVKNREGRFTLANRAVAAIYGTTPEDLEGKGDADFNHGPAEVEAFLKDDRAVMDSRQPKLIPEEPVTNPETGATRWFHTVKVPLVDADGESRQILGVASDITDRKRLEDQLRQSQKMEAVGQLTGGIAHDLNNILTAIMANAGLMESILGPNQTDLRADLTELQKAAGRGAAMVRKLLAFSRREMLAMKAVRLDHLITDIATTMRRLLPPTIDIKLHTEPGLPRVRADAGAVEQMILNLATNARDAMPDGGLLLIEASRALLDEEACESLGWGKPGNYVCLSASDTGVGMDRQTQRRVFEPFFTTKPTGEGTGLGLAMVYGLMRQHEGYTRVYSELGQGTTIKLYFPEQDSVSEHTVEHPVAVKPQGGTERILVVEDEEQLRRVVTRVLERSGYRVKTASDGEEALELLSGDRDGFDLVLSDVVMPRLGGRQLAERARATGVVTPFLFTSGYTARDVRESASLDPHAPFLHKPWTVGDLLAKVREVMDASH